MMVGSLGETTIVKKLANDPSQITVLEEEQASSN
jgi:hypothetical protein